MPARWLTLCQLRVSTVLAAVLQCFAELLSTTMQGDNQLWNFFPWVALICMGATVASQLHFLAVALNYFDALYAVPVFQCLYVFFAFPFFALKIQLYLHL